MFRQLVLCSAIAAMLAFPAAGWAGGPQPGDLLGSTGQIGGSLIDVDPGTGAGTVIGSLGSFGPVTEIDFRADGVLFGTTGGGSSNLIVIDPATGGETLIGAHDLDGATNGLEFVGGTLYGSFFESGGPAVQGGAGDGIPDTLLVTIDQADASLTVIGTITGFFPVRGLAYDVAAGIMYGIGTPVLGPPPPPPATAPEGLSDVLFTVDLATGAPTVVGPTGQSLGSLEFGPDGTLYAGEVLTATAQGGDGWGAAGAHGDAGLGAGGRLFTLDPATGAATAVGPTGFAVISGLSFVPAGEVLPSVLEIPSLSRFGLLLLAALLAAAGLFAVRRA